MSERCPKCGAGVSEALSRIYDRTQFACESYLLPGNEEFVQSFACVAAENARLRAVGKKWVAEARRLIDCLNAYDGVGIPRSDAADAFALLRKIASEEEKP